MRLLRPDGVLIDVEERWGVLRELLDRTPAVVAAYLLGSYGTRHQTPLSDVDLAFVFRLGSEPGFSEEMRFRGEVFDALLEDDVSVIFLNRVPPILQMKVLETGRQIYCADESAPADVVERTLNVYGDFMIDYRWFLEGYDATLLVEYGRG